MPLVELQMKNREEIFCILEISGLEEVTASGCCNWNNSTQVEKCEK
jgi:hypothetical protein